MPTAGIESPTECKEVLVSLAILLAFWISAMRSLKKWPWLPGGAYG